MDSAVTSQVDVAADSVVAAIHAILALHHVSPFGSAPSFQASDQALNILLSAIQLLHTASLIDSEKSREGVFRQLMPWAINQLNLLLARCHMPDKSANTLLAAVQSLSQLPASPSKLCNVSFPTYSPLHEPKISRAPASHTRYSEHNQILMPMQEASVPNSMGMDGIAGDASPGQYILSPQEWASSFMGDYAIPYRPVMNGPIHPDEPRAFYASYAGQRQPYPGNMQPASVFVNDSTSSYQQYPSHPMYASSPQKLCNQPPPFVYAQHPVYLETNHLA